MLHLLRGEQVLALAIANERETHQLQRRPYRPEGVDVLRVLVSNGSQFILESHEKKLTS